MSALPLLLAAGSLTCRATPVRRAADEPVSAASALPKPGAAIVVAATEKVERESLPDAAPGDVDLSQPTPAEDLPETDARETTPSLLWLYALGGCTAVAMAAWIAD